MKLVAEVREDGIESKSNCHQGSFHYPEISYTLWRNPFVLNENPSKIVKCLCSGKISHAVSKTWYASRLSRRSNGVCGAVELVFRTGVFNTNATGGSIFQKSSVFFIISFLCKFLWYLSCTYHIPTLQTMAIFIRQNNKLLVTWLIKETFQASVPFKKCQTVPYLQNNVDNVQVF